VDFVAFVAYQAEGYVCPSVRADGVLAPYGAAEFEYVVVDVEGERDVEVVAADGRVGALRFCGLEVEE